MELLKRKHDDSVNVTKKLKTEHVQIIQPGLVLVKGYLNEEQQCQIMEKVVNFSPDMYVPKIKLYGKECSMHLNMTCLGKHWNAMTYKYEDTRSDKDGHAVSKLPDEWTVLCNEAVSFVQKHDSSIPDMIPQAVIVNHYIDSTQKLGFHQDTSEDKKLRDAGVPVVSFSIGSSCRFGYYPRGQKSNKKYITLSSGDLLIFGGQSRMIFHGVDQVGEESLPIHKSFRQLKMGRVNLTFRQIK